MSLATTVERRKFQFGRHETFALREGWYGKALRRLQDPPFEFKSDLTTADELGLGSRMVKSLGFWLNIGGLCELEREGKSRVGRLVPSALGNVIARYDLDVEYPATLWIVHLAITRQYGTIWHWFFNDFGFGAFDRSACVDAFDRHVHERAVNPTTRAVLQRDVGCLLQTYVAAGPDSDPEDVAISPMRALGLVLRHRESGRYEKVGPLDSIPVEAFLATCAQLADEQERDALPLGELLRARNSPGRLMNLDGDTIADLAQQSAELYVRSGVELYLSGADRMLRVPRLRPDKWLQMHFMRVGAGL